MAEREAQWQNSQILLWAAVVFVGSSLVIMIYYSQKQSFMTRKKLTLISEKQHPFPFIDMFWEKRHKKKRSVKTDRLYVEFLVVDDFHKDKFEVILYKKKRKSVSSLIYRSKWFFHPMSFLQKVNGAFCTFFRLLEVIAFFFFSILPTIQVQSSFTLGGEKKRVGGWSYSAMLIFVSWNSFYVINWILTLMEVNIKVYQPGRYVLTKTN